MLDTSESMLARSTLRRALLAVVVICLVGLLTGYLTGPHDPTVTDGFRPTEAGGYDPAALESAANITVAATQGVPESDARGELVALTGDGTIAYRNGTLQTYFDVDPVEGEPYVVEYVGAEKLTGDACAGVSTDPCSRNVYERLNLRTDETTRLWSQITPRIPSNRYHDIDRVNETHIAVADIYEDALYTIDLATGEEVWRWNADEAYDRSSGGSPGDWTHVNDIEALPDGRFMASLRNQDSAVFLRPGEGLLANQTLGADDTHDILYEQHNPDYIPESDGGPSVPLADSENRRVVEYQLQDGEWVQTWAWTDARLQWPRDADRLPDGSTLVTDSHGDRVIEVAPDGTVLWSATVRLPYEAERLATPSESGGGPALDTGNPGIDPGAGLLANPGYTLRTAVPQLAVNGLLYVSPSWILYPELLVVLALALTLLGWGVTELWWRRDRIRAAVGRAR
ncbi:MAG: arylsulfotransferase (asst) [Halobacteriales archaeon]|nr:arylsulfotransferase (asst) [Halobacteriales archaeon]